MHQVYELVLALLEQLEVDDKTDDMISCLGGELSSNHKAETGQMPALDNAIRFLMEEALKRPQIRKKLEENGWDGDWDLNDTAMTCNMMRLITYELSKLHAMQLAP